MAVTGDNNLYVYVLNVGQGDTSVIVTPEGNLMIIDAVKPSKLVDLLGKLGLAAGGEIEELILTHPHTDHFSAANRILTDYKVLSVKLAPFWNEFGMGPPTYRELINNIEKEQCPVSFVSGYSRVYPDGALTSSGDSSYAFDPDCAYVELLGPSNSMISKLEECGKLDTNHLSVMSRLTWRDFRMVFAADAQMENWSCFDNENMLDESCNVLRAAHHGSCNGTQWERIKRLNPKSVFVSSDPDKKHKLPDLIGASIFGKYEVDEEEKLVALTKETGTVRITVKNGSSKPTIESFGEHYEADVDLAKASELSWSNNGTDWKKLMDEKADALFP